ncbi:MAG: hypothetical protein KDC06_11645 [Chitinophagaceae bacterium]|nr:hypothetical protein [Chitinophagaceae bacterium]
MRVVTFITSPIVLLVMLSMSSCNKYIDATNGSTSIEQGSLKFYTDSNLFTFRTNVVATRDKEKVYPKFFEVKLPKKIKYNEFINSTDFGFYYDKGQVIFIKMELEPKTQTKDTTYTPSQHELKQLIQSVLKTNGGKYDIKKIPAHKKRRNTILIRGEATILLFNIVDDNYKQFFNNVGSFKFIK